MTRAALVWSDGEQLRVAELRENRSSVISRSPDAAIVLRDQTVSRRPHVIVRSEQAGFLIEHLLRDVSPTWVNNVVVDRPVTLSDKDAIQIGAVRLVFHDLAQADQVRYPLLCSHCRRENDLSRNECWYCGTALVNAPSIVPVTTPVLCRIVSADGESYDLFAGDAFIALPGRGGEVHRIEQLPDGVSAIVNPPDCYPTLLIPAGNGGVLLNDAAPRDGQPPKTGDEVQLGGHRYAVIVR